jgi:hypothetical protein
VLHVLVQDVVQRRVLLGRPDEIVHLDGEVGLHFSSGFRGGQSTGE